MNLNFFSPRAWCVLIGLLIVGTFGCKKPSPEVVAVSGSVTLDDTPLSGAAVCFTSPSGYVASAPLDGEGRFQLMSQYGPGIPPGHYQITILPRRQIDPTDPATMTGSKVTQSGPAIPIKFQFPHSSGLTAVVEGSEAKLQFAISTKLD